jgi:hypothetical protein
VGRGHLAVGVLEQIAEAAVKHAGRTGAQGRAVVAGLDPPARRLDPDQLDVVVQEGGEDPDRVGSAAHTGDHGPRQPSDPLQELLPRLAADHRLEVAHHAGIGIGTDHGADDVVRGGHVGDPVAQRLIGRVLQRAGAGLDRDHGRAEEAHAVHVQRLAGHVLRAHVDHALQPEPGAHRRGGDTVLARAGLGDDAPLAHPPREQRLAHRVVDLVRPGMVEVLALEQHGGAHLVGKPRRQGNGRWPSHELGQQRIELRPEGRVRPGRVVERGQVVERGHERLGNVAAAIGAESSADRPLSRQ